MVNLKHCEHIAVCPSGRWTDGLTLNATPSGSSVHLSEDRDQVTQALPQSRINPWSVPGRGEVTVRIGPSEKAGSHRVERYRPGYRWTHPDLCDSVFVVWVTLFTICEAVAAN